MKGSKRKLLAMTVSSPAPELLLPYGEKWIAHTPDGKRIVASGRRLQNVIGRLRSLKIKKGDAVLMYIPPVDATLCL